MTRLTTSSPFSWLLVGLSLAVALFFLALFTELGQLMNLPSDWLYASYPWLGVISIVLLVVGALVLYRHFSVGALSRRLVSLYLIALVGILLLTNYFVPYIWLRGHHHTAEFISVAEADKLLANDEDVFVLAIGDEARAYPKDWMMLPHIAGDTVGGEEVVMTYCVLTNLPMAYNSEIDGHEADLKVVSQAHNNLVMADRNSGELYQQITSTAPVSGKTLERKAGQRMPWSSFKALYPQGKVFRVEESGPFAWVDAITYKMFVLTLGSQYEGPEPMFPTLRMDDDRLPPKEQIWGLSFNDEQVAYTRSYLEKNPVINTIVGGEPVLVAWFPEYQTLGVFSREIDGQASEIMQVDAHGNTQQGQLKRLPQYPHVLWMVWSHWFPDTKVDG